MPPQSERVSPTSYRATETMDLKRAYKQQTIRSSDPSADQRSIGGASATNSAAPSSVYLPCTPLTRELSDLSGPFFNGTKNRGSKGPSVPGHIYDEPSVKGPWRQAYVLSQLPPDKADPRASENSSTMDATIVVSRSDVVEIINSLEATLDLDKLQAQGHNRIPVLVLLMHGAKHSYELMQIWVDRTTDSVRDVVHALQQSVPDNWKQDYDGIFQVRGNRFTQLIHLLRIGKYDAQPHEIFIAKPWSMTAKVTISYATSAIRHLTAIGVINTNEHDNSGKRVFRPKSEETPLLLCKKAQDRIYAPEGILSHHHATQFMTFSPPFDPNRKPVEIHNERDDANSSLGSQCSDPLLNKDVLRESGPASHAKSNQVVPLNGESVADSTNKYSAAGSDFEDGHCGRRRSFGQMVSKLNCCKNKERLLDFTSSAPAFTLSEEDEQRWSSFDIGPIAEDRSLAGVSVVSMSAPLLSTHKVQPNAHRSRMEPLAMSMSEF